MMAGLVGLARAPTQRGEKARRRILEVVQAVPGINKGELQRMVGLAWGTVGHHLRVLAGRGLVHVDATQHQANIYPGSVTRQEFAWIQALRDPLANSILRQVHQTPGVGIQGLADQMGGVSRKTIRRHLANLQAVGAIRKEARYQPRFHPAAQDGAPKDRVPKPPEGLQQPALLASAGEPREGDRMLRL